MCTKRALRLTGNFRVRYTDIMRSEGTGARPVSVSEGEKKEERIGGGVPGLGSGCGSVSGSGKTSMMCVLEVQARSGPQEQDEVWVAYELS